MELIKLDVGGYRYKTTLATLQSRRGSMLERMFGGTELSPSLLDEDGFYFIDRNGRIFEYILDFLRGFQYPPSTLPESDIELLQTEADFYGLEELRDWAGRRLITHQEEKKDEQLESLPLSTLKQIHNSAIQAAHVWRVSYLTAKVDTMESPVMMNLDHLNLSGVNMSGWSCVLVEKSEYSSDLTTKFVFKISAVGSNFRNANLRNAKFPQSIFTDANFEGADLRGADLRKANLRGANFKDADLTDAMLWDADTYKAKMRFAIKNDSRRPRRESFF